MVRTAPEKRVTLHIAWATDGSDSAMEAVGLLRGRFNNESVRVSVLVVGRGSGVPNVGLQERAKVDTIGAPALPIEFYDADEPARVTPQLVLDEAKRALEGVRASVSYTMLVGRPVDALVQWLTEERPTVALVGSSGRGRAERWLLGSVSTGMAFRAPCSVFVMRSPSGGEGALVGYDHSDDVEVALGLLNPLLVPTSPLKLLTVVPHRALFPESIRPRFVDSLARASADRYIARQSRLQLEVAARSLRTGGFTRIATTVVFGDPAEELGREVRTTPPDLLVLGAAGRRGVRMFPGNVTERLLHESRCSVLIGRA